MARITVEDCLETESNRFSLVRLAARRAKQLLSGSDPVTDTKGNRAIVSALREIADGKVRFKEDEEQNDEFDGLSAYVPPAATETAEATPAEEKTETPAEGETAETPLQQAIS